MLLNKDQIQSIKENKVTFVKNFVTLNRPYDFNLISKLIEENDLQSMSKSNYGGLRDVFQIRGVVNLLKEFNVLFDFFNKTFNYKYDQKNNVDLFLSLISQVGVPHIDEEDVFIIGLNGNMVYKVFNDKIVDYHISKGDLIFIPKGVKHKVMGLSSRISMSVGFFNKRN
tara:strand:- start:1763 stop:2269 length:507 start_codon:yes stop_codon:yes gene_type:complete